MSVLDTREIFWKSRQYNMKYEENEILHEIFRLVLRFPCYISCYIAENLLLLWQCARSEDFVSCNNAAKALSKSKILNSVAQGPSERTKKTKVENLVHCLCKGYYQAFSTPSGRLFTGFTNLAFYPQSHRDIRSFSSKTYISAESQILTRPRAVPHGQIQPSFNTF